MTQNGKGSGRRPQQVDDKKVRDNWDRIFNKNKTSEKNKNDCPDK